MKKTVLYIDAGPKGYSPEQCSETLTVGELIDALTDLDEDMPIYLKFDKGYTYGSIAYYDLVEDEIEEDE